MDKGSEFVRLEKFVDDLLAKYKFARKQCVELEARLEERDAECEKLQATIEELRGERNDVGDRVAGLIERIEQWERELEASELEDADHQDPELENSELANQAAMEKQQGKLFQGDQPVTK